MTTSPPDVPSPRPESKEACPRCGQHQLAVIELPDLANPLPYEPANELFGMGTDLHVGGSPSIGCLHCGAEWPDLEAFRREASGDSAEAKG